MLSGCYDRHLSSLLRCEIEQRFNSGYPRLSRALTSNQLESNTMARDGSSKFVETIHARLLKVSASLIKGTIYNLPEGGCKTVGNAEFNRIIGTLTGSWVLKPIPLRKHPDLM